jgi:hypothetical protein
VLIFSLPQAFEDRDFKKDPKLQTESLQVTAENSQGEARESTPECRDSRLR